MLVDELCSGCCNGKPDTGGSHHDNPCPLCRQRRAAAAEIEQITKDRDFWKRRADQRQITINELKQNPPDAPVPTKDCGHAPHLWKDAKTCRCGKPTSEIVPEKDSCPHERRIGDGIHYSKCLDCGEYLPEQSSDDCPHLQTDARGHCFSCGSDVLSLPEKDTKP